MRFLPKDDGKGLVRIRAQGLSPDFHAIVTGAEVSTTSARLFASDSEHERRCNSDMIKRRALNAYEGDQTVVRSKLPLALNPEFERVTRVGTP